MSPRIPPARGRVTVAIDGDWMHTLAHAVLTKLVREGRIPPGAFANFEIDWRDRTMCIRWPVPDDAPPSKGHLRLIRGDG